jgi:Flp pilus assembly protein CpaB
MNMRWSGLLWWSGAFITATLAALFTFALLKRTAPAAQNVILDTRTVVVAVSNIPFRRSISPSEVTIRTLPAESVPEGAAVSIDQVVGKMATVDLFANQPVLTQQLVSPDVVTQQVALSVPDGKEVMVVPTSSKLISNLLLRTGDHIDLLGTFDIEISGEDGKEPLAVSAALLQDLEVHAIILPVAPAEGGPGVVQDSQGGILRTMDEQGQSLLLALDPQDGLTVHHILNVGGSIDIMLRAPGDDTVTNPVVVDQYYLMNRYQISAAR